MNKKAKKKQRRKNTPFVRKNRVRQRRHKVNIEPELKCQLCGKEVERLFTSNLEGLDTNEEFICEECLDKKIKVRP